MQCCWYNVGPTSVLFLFSGQELVLVKDNSFPLTFSLFFSLKNVFHWLWMNKKTSDYQTAILIFFKSHVLPATLLMLTHKTTTYCVEAIRNWTTAFHRVWAEKILIKSLLFLLTGFFALWKIFFKISVFSQRHMANWHWPRWP